jgi:hypothetical protein
MILNIPSQIIIKAYDDSQNGGIIHAALYFGKHPMKDTLDSQVGIEWDKGTGVTVTDPSGFVKDVSVSRSFAFNENIFTFTFTPVKPMDISDVSVRLWNNNLASVDRIFDSAVIFSGEFLAPSPMKLSTNLKVYDNFGDLERQLEVDGYDKPSLFSKIHDTYAVFGDSPGKVTFLYDPENKLVSLVLADGFSKVISIQSQSLVELTLLPKAYDNQQFLNPDNPTQIQAAKATESIKALKSMMDIYGRNYMLQYQFLGTR